MSQTATGETPPYGFGDNAYLLRALVAHAPEDNVRFAVDRLIDVAIAHPLLPARLVLEIITQVTASGEPNVVFVNESGGEQVVEEGVDSPAPSRATMTQAEIDQQVEGYRRQLEEGLPDDPDAPNN